MDREREIGHHAKTLSLGTTFVYSLHGAFRRVDACRSPVVIGCQSLRARVGAALPTYRSVNQSRHYKLTMSVDVLIWPESSHFSTYFCNALPRLRPNRYDCGSLAARSPALRHVWPG